MYESKDITCPYCEKDMDVYDYSEETPGEYFQYTCENCGKEIFVQVEYYPSFDVEKADCLNVENPKDSDHSWSTTYSSYYGEYQHCLCGAEKNKMSEEDAKARHEKDMEEFRQKKLKKNQDELDEKLLTILGKEVWYYPNLNNKEIKYKVTVIGGKTDSSNYFNCNIYTVKIIGYDKNGNMNKEIEVHESNLEIIKEDAVG
jgi:hypothetical protein